MTSMISRLMSLIGISSRKVVQPMNTGHDMSIRISVPSETSSSYDGSSQSSPVQKQVSSFSSRLPPADQLKLDHSAGVSNSQLRLKLILLDSLLLRIKKLYGDEAELICDQALLSCILDIKRKSGTKFVDLSVLSEIDCIHQQLLDNEGMYRLERQTKTEREKHSKERDEKQLEITSHQKRYELEMVRMNETHRLTLFVFGGSLLVLLLSYFLVLTKIQG